MDVRPHQRCVRSFLQNHCRHCPAVCHGGMEAALGKKEQKNRHRKVTWAVEARICAIACSEPPEGAFHWTLQAIADELIRLEVVDYITDSTICEVMKKRNQAVACKGMMHSVGECRIRGKNGGCTGSIPAPI